MWHVFKWPEDAKQARSSAAIHGIQIKSASDTHSAPVARNPRTHITPHSKQQFSQLFERRF